MPLYALGNLVPTLADGAWAAPSADLIGDVRLGPRASVWFGAIIRADNTPILVGEDSNVQDGAVGHSDPGAPLTIGARVTVGHGAVVHGATVEDDCLIGMRSVILNGARVGAGSLIAAGAVVLEGAEIPPGSLVAGVPGKVRRELSADERAALEESWRGYVRRAERHAAAAEKSGNPA